MRYHLILFITSFMLCGTFVNSQKLTRIDTDITSNEKIFTLDELDSIFATNGAAEVEYLEYKRLINSRENSKTAAAILGGVSVLSTVVIATFPKQDNLSSELALYLGLGLIGVSSGITALSFLINVGITNKKAKKRINNAINSINEDTGLIEKERNHHFNLGGVPNGIGITYSF